MEERSRKRRTRKKGSKVNLLFVFCLGVFLIYILACFVFDGEEISFPLEDAGNQHEVEIPDWITQQFLTVSDYSRPGRSLDQVNGIVVHYVANPGSTGWDNWHYFENLKDTHTTKASTHFIIGLDGTIIQCIPLDEISYCSNNRNWDTIAIECCHPDETGKFSKKTYKSLVKLCKWLRKEYGLEEEDVIRHYDVTGKLCPLYYVEHEDAWEKFHKDI